MLLRTLILLNIWCNKCLFNREQAPYHTDLVLYKAWKITIYIKMEAWRNLQRHHRTPELQHSKNRAFTKIWTANNIFATTRNKEPTWHLISPPQLLPKTLAQYLGADQPRSRPSRLTTAPVTQPSTSQRIAPE